MAAQKKTLYQCQNELDRKFLYQFRFVAKLLDRVAEHLSKNVYCAVECFTPDTSCLIDSVEFTNITRTIQ